jgi:hypothetical protein
MASREDEPSWLDSWLLVRSSESRPGKYWHRSYVPRGPARPEHLTRLRDYVQGAHQDARTYIDSIFTTTLDPSGVPLSARVGYPAALPPAALTGYFGECLAGLVLEHGEPFGDGNYRVPVFLFRFHDTAINWLLRRTAGPVEGAVPGRPGTDVIGFRIDPAGSVDGVVAVEAKCLTHHDMAKLREAHVQLSDLLGLPVSIRQVLQVLRDRRDDESKELARSIAQLFLAPPKSGFRRDMVVYTCAQEPKAREAWAPTSGADPAYRGGRPLLVVELHMPDLASLVAHCYSPSQPPTPERTRSP